MSFGRWIVLSVTLACALLGASFLKKTEQPARFIASRSQKDALSQLIESTRPFTATWNFKNCNRVELSPQIPVRAAVPSLPTLRMGDESLSLRVVLKSPSPMIRSVLGTVLSPQGKSLFWFSLLSTVPVSFQEGDLTRTVWTRDLSRTEMQLIQGEGVRRIVYQEITNGTGLQRREFSITTMNSFEGNTGFTLFQFSSDGDYLERILDARSVGHFLAPRYLITQQQVVGQCGGGFGMAAKPADWANGIPPAEAVSDLNSQQLKFSVAVPYLKVKSPTDLPDEAMVR